MLESVEEALIRLEGLLQELHVSSSNSGKEHLKAACSDLEKIRRLKKEAEFLEASFGAKAASLQQVYFSYFALYFFWGQVRCCNLNELLIYRVILDLSSTVILDYASCLFNDI